MTSSYAPWEKSTPAIERPFRSYGECFFGKDTAMTTCWGASMVAQLLYPGENAMAAGLSCTMSAYLAVVAGKSQVAGRLHGQLDYAPAVLAEHALMKQASMQ